MRWRSTGIAAFFTSSMATLKRPSIAASALPASRRNWPARGHRARFRCRKRHYRGGCVRSERDGDGAYIPALQDGHGDPPAPLPDNLPLPHRSGIRLDACADADLVPVLHACVHQWPRVVEPPHGPGRPALFPPGSLFPLGGGCSPSPATVRGTTHGELDRTASAVRTALESHARGNLPQLPGAILLDWLPM